MTLTPDVVSSLKNNTSEKFSIAIKDNNDKAIGSLVLVQKRDANNPIILEALTRWRKKYMKYFLTQFNASTNRTKSWLENIVIPSSDRLLFLILNEDNNLIGNFGIADILFDRCELDNLIRGEKGGHPKLIYFSELSLLKWLFLEKKVKRVNLHVFANNLPTIKLHKSVGFVEIGRRKLERVQSKDGDVSFEETQICSEGNSIEYLELMLESNDFNDMYVL